MVDISAKEAIAKVQINEIRMKEMENQARNILSTLDQLSLTIDTIKSLPEEKKQSFTPLGSGVYAPSTLAKQNLSIDIGSGVIIEKGIEDTLELLKNREKQLKDTLDTLNKTGRELNIETAKLKKKLQEYYQKQEGSHDSDVPVIG